MRLTADQRRHLRLDRAKEQAGLRAEARTSDVYIYIYIYICVYVCVCVYIYIYIYTQIRMYRHNYKHMYIYIYIYTHHAIISSYKVLHATEVL